MIKTFYEDKYIIVCEKPVGVLSEFVLGQKNMPEMLKKQTGVYKIDTIHRLDRNVGGVMVYSKNGKATLPLAKMMANHKFTKEYLAVIHGELKEKSGVFEDYLVKDKTACKVFAVKRPTEKSKYAKLEYTVLEEKDGLSLVRVKLHTGRTHQIRVQFASRGYYLLGDTKYGEQSENDNGKTPIALWSYHLGFKHPLFDKILSIVSIPPAKSVFFRFKWLKKQNLIENV